MKRIVLMYHDIYELNPDESGFNRKSMLQYKLSKDVFEEQVKAVCLFAASHHDLEVVFSFDDGGVSFFSIAAPILEAYGQTGLFFISTKYLGSKGFLTKDQLCELEKRGHVIGSHSYSHPENIIALSPEAQEEEWIHSFEDLKTILGHPINDVSIPNGYFDKKAQNIFERYSIRNLFTSEPTTKVETQKSINTYGRYVIHSGMTKEDVLCILSSKKKRGWLKIRWTLLSILKNILGKYYNSIKQISINAK